MNIVEENNPRDKKYTKSAAKQAYRTAVSGPWQRNDVFTSTIWYTLYYCTLLA